MWMFLSDGLTEDEKKTFYQAKTNNPKHGETWGLSSTLNTLSRVTCPKQLTQWAHSSGGFCWTFWRPWMTATHETHSPMPGIQPFNTVGAQIYPFHLIIRTLKRDFTRGYTRLQISIWTVSHCEQSWVLLQQVTGCIVYDIMSSTVS